MNTYKPIKCASRDFTATPFYLIQYYESAKRYVASFQDKERIKQFLTLFIDQSVDEVQIKIYDAQNSENPKEYEGVVTKAKLKDTLNKYEEVVYHNGCHDLMIRQPETGDYIAFDEHGMIFIYTEDDFATILEHFGLVYKPNENLIETFGHWHYRTANGEQDLKGLIHELELK